MRIAGLIFATSLIVGSLLTGCASRSFSLTSVWEDPWPHHGEVLTVTLYPRDTGHGDYLVCIDPCLNRAPGGIGNTWVIPSDPEAFKAWNGTRAVRMRVRVDASSHAPDAVAGHFPLWLEEVPPDGAEARP
ncbi:MAG: hypothetical protein EON87_20720 [Brevundimonas sp.]|nr:MAG: hypothetical protein EON87_20720 [Brevundimonas sp.]